MRLLSVNIFMIGNRYLPLNQPLLYRSFEYVPIPPGREREVKMALLKTCQTTFVKSITFFGRRDRPWNQRATTIGGTRCWCKQLLSYYAKLAEAKNERSRRRNFEIIARMLIDSVLIHSTLGLNSLGKSLEILTMRKLDWLCICICLHEKFHNLPFTVW